MVSLREWERRAKWQRQGRTWIELPREEEINISHLPIHMRPLGNSISSMQYTTPFVIWASNKVQNYFGIERE